MSALSPLRFRVASSLLLVGCCAAACASRARLSASDSGFGSIEEGIASWYGGSDGFEGKPTASGEIYDGSLLTAAHRELPLGTVVDVTNLTNGKTVRVRINDRGPFIKGRIIDLSRTAANKVELIGPGTAPVRLAIVRLGVEPPPVSPNGLWAVQVGSFAERRNADLYLVRLHRAGHGAYLEPYQGLSRVKVGPFDSRERARERLERLRGEGYEGIVVPANLIQAAR